jgi:hypothetical protein
VGAWASITAAVCGSMGFIPQLGFVHAADTPPFIYDAAELYNHHFISYGAGRSSLSDERKTEF